MKMKLYHGSYDRLTDMTVRAGNLFNGMFFAADKESAFGPGGEPHYYYTVDIDNDDIAGVDELAYEATSVDAAHALWENDADTMLDIVCDEVTPWEADDEQREVLERRFPALEDWEMSYELQRQASLLAEKMGYKAVAVHDEHGISYIVCPGIKMEEEL